MTPSYLQRRLALCTPLPRVVLAPVTRDQNDVDGQYEKRWKTRTLVAFLVGTRGGPKGAAIPREGFLLWDPLRRKLVDAKTSNQG